MKFDPKDWRAWVALIATIIVASLTLVNSVFALPELVSKIFEVVIGVTSVICINLGITVGAIAKK